MTCVSSGRIWSLWDMLKEVDPEGVVKSISLLSSESKRLALGYDAASAEALGMIGIARAAARLRVWIQGAHQQQGKLSPGDVRQLADGMNAVVVGYGDELDGRKLFVMTPQYAHYYSPVGPRFGDEVANAFPDSVDDIDEAGKCLALGLPTACVFHLMRGAECAAAVILTRLGGEPKDEHGEIRSFGSLARSIETEIDKMSRGPKKDDWMKLKSFMASINRGMRTKVAHPGTTYSETKAENLIGLTKGFLQEAEELLRRP